MLFLGKENETPFLFMSFSACWLPTVCSVECLHLMEAILWMNENMILTISFTFPNKRMIWLLYFMTNLWHFNILPQTRIYIKWSILSSIFVLLLREWMSGLKDGLVQVQERFLKRLFEHVPFTLAWHGVKRKRQTFSSR